MANNSPSEENGSVSSEAFEEWLQQAADSKGVSKQELMNQMLSSYWILDELTGLVGETNGGATDHRTPGPDEPVDASEDGSDGGHQAPTQSDTESGDEPGTHGGEPPEQASSGSDSTEESIQAIQAAIRELVEKQPAFDDQQSPGSTDSTSNPLDGGVVAVVSDLQRQVGRFESTLDDLENRQDKQVDRFSTELQLLLDRVGELELERDRYVTERDFESLTSDVGELDDRTRELDDRTQELNDRTQELEAETEDIDARLEREFDSIEELFRRVLDTIEELDDELDTTSDAYSEELLPIKQRESDREQLQALKEEAIHRDVRRGRCEGCGQSVDLAMLETPDCPNCPARFTGIDDSGWNPFRSPTLETDQIDET